MLMQNRLATKTPVHPNSTSVFAVCAVLCLSCASTAFAQTGACCREQGGTVCTLDTMEHCTIFLGSYMGDGTNCATATCLASPRGACCGGPGSASPGYCLVTDGGDAGCSAYSSGFTYLGDGTSCYTDPTGCGGLPCNRCPTCGDDQVNGPGEECDGTADSACPGECQQDCTCPGGLGSCCDHDPFGGCTDDVLERNCSCTKCEWFGDLSCAEVECTHNAIPTVSEWGLLILALSLLTGAKLRFGRRTTPG